MGDDIPRRAMEKMSKHLPKGQDVEIENRNIRRIADYPVATLLEILDEENQSDCHLSTNI